MLPPELVSRDWVGETTTIVVEELESIAICPEESCIGCASSRIDPKTTYASIKIISNFVSYNGVDICNGLNNSSGRAVDVGQRRAVNVTVAVGRFDGGNICCLSRSSELGIEAGRISVKVINRLKNSISSAINAGYGCPINGAIAINRFDGRDVGCICRSSELGIEAGGINVEGSAIGIENSNNIGSGSVDVGQ